MSATAGASTGALLRLLATAAPLTQQELRAATGRSTNQVQSALSQLLENDRIARVGRHGKSRYCLPHQVPPDIQTAGAPDWPRPASDRHAPLTWRIAA